MNETKFSYGQRSALDIYQEINLDMRCWVMGQ
jgi:hypothetical protein